MDLPILDGFDLNVHDGNLIMSNQDFKDLKKEKNVDLVAAKAITIIGMMSSKKPEIWKKRFQKVYEKTKISEGCWSENKMINMLFLKTKGKVKKLILDSWRKGKDVEDILDKLDEVFKRKVESQVNAKKRLQNLKFKSFFDIERFEEDLRLLMSKIYFHYSDKM